jgi:hypothetical protein
VIFPPEKHRPLSVLERSCWHVNRAASHNLLTLAEVEGPVRREDLRKGLDALQERYPLLGVRILRAGGRLVFCGEKVPAVPMQIQDVPQETWCARAELELCRALPVEEGPLARCVLLRHAEGRATILLTFLHAIGDGHAGFLLMRDLLGFTAGTDPVPVGPEKPGQIPLPLSEYLPKRVKGVRGSLLRARMMGRELSGYLREGGVPHRLALDSRPPYFLRRTGMFPVRFPRDLTDLLIRRARRERTSIHGAICAAGLLAVSSVMTDGRPRVLSCTSAVNMRSRIDPSAAEHAGLFVSVLWVGQKVWKGQPFWDLARRVRTKFSGKIERGDPSLVAGGGKLLLPFLERLPGKHPSERIVRLAESLMYNFRGTGVSYVGRLEMPERLGELSVRSVSFAGSLVNLGYFLAVANTFNGRLQINYLYNDPLILRERASRLAETAVAVLRGAVD